MCCVLSAQAISIIVMPSTILSDSAWVKSFVPTAAVPQIGTTECVESATGGGTVTGTVNYRFTGFRFHGLSFAI